MKETEIKKAAQDFAAFWQDKGYEKGQSQSFWLSLLRNVLGVEFPEKYIRFEDQIKLDHTSFIDGFIDTTHVLIEQKGADKDLRKPIRQSDGTLLTPFQQAKRYAAELPYSARPRWIVTCNFKEFLIYDMEKPTGEPESIMLKDLAKEYYRLQFLVEEKSELAKREEIVSVQAGEIVGKLYDAILKQYIHPEDKTSLHSLNILCVRLVFCLYAEDSGIFGGDHNLFRNYIKSFDVRDVRRALIDLFKVLDTKIDDRDRYIDDRLSVFPYVNGGLFADENIEIPNFTQEIVDLLLHKASEDFDWSQISPTIFGAVFESTLNPETRRSGGMHYTSIENIHKVIDPLFLDELREEFDTIKALKVTKIRKDKAKAFQEKLSKLTFFDPACGSGNFLTETYISLRRLENEALKIVNEEQIAWDFFDDVIKVSIGQFYGIEINDFAVTVAKTALWIAESQMMRETEEILNTTLEFLPLKSYANIVEGNALRIDWETVVPKEKLNYIMGNPPFVGASMMTKEQKDDAVAIFGRGSRVNSIDYVGAWYHKAEKMIQNTPVRVALVSTNSITQGEQVAPLWEKLFLKYGIHIDFGYRTFYWDNEATQKAHVHCVIIGFSVAPSSCPKFLFSAERMQIVDNINPYLYNAPTVFIENRAHALCDVPRITKGNYPTDGGNLILNEEERDNLLIKDPNLAECIRRYVGAKDFINNDVVRYCLWLKGVSPSIYRKNSDIMGRLEAVREMRLNSSAAPTRAMADKPYLFFSTPQTDSNYICIPEVSSERRKYIPIGFMDKSIIASNTVLIIPEATLYHFGVLTSNVHNAWMRAVGGRLKSDYRYSGAIVYNNFPWCTPTTEQKKKIEETAQAILDARALYPDCSLADLYDEVAMPPELRKAHQANDKAVMQAYGFWGKLNTESACVAELMKMYQQLTENHN